jgi:hypothetical protein
MPTQYPRIQSTRTPQLERALAVGARRWPGLEAGRVLTQLAEYGAAALEREQAGPPSARLHQFPATGVVIRQSAVEDALDED